MSRKNIAEERTAKPKMAYGRQAMWNYMRENITFTLPDLADFSKRNKRSVATYLAGLIAGGFVVKDGVLESSKSKQYDRILYKLINDVGYIAPRVRKDGSMVRTSRENMWATMKVLPLFTFEELALASTTEECTVSPIDAQNYCKHLTHAGYLLKLGVGKKATFRLVPAMNTGFHAPMVQRSRVVFDPNKNAIMWHEELEP